MDDVRAQQHQRGRRMTAGSSVSDVEQHDDFIDGDQQGGECVCVFMNELHYYYYSATSLENISNQQQQQGIQFIRGSVNLSSSSSNTIRNLWSRAVCKKCAQPFARVRDMIEHCCIGGGTAMTTHNDSDNCGTSGMLQRPVSGRCL
jgi:hypothetical protein